MRYIMEGIAAWVLLSLLVTAILMYLGWHKDIRPSDEEWNEFQRYMRKRTHR